MAAEGNSVFWPLVIGGVGAIAAIYVKEAVQAALKRQIMLGQLQAYVMHWKGLVVRHLHAVQLYNTIEEREKKLTESLTRGREAFNAQHTENVGKRDEIRAKIKEALQEVVDDGKSFDKSSMTSAVFGAGLDGFVTTRQYLMDGKTFISDSDAAHLGPAIALSTVAFRASAAQILLALEGIVKMMQAIDNNTKKSDVATVISSFVDAFVLDGENFFVHLIRLERHVQVARRRNLLQLTGDVFRGR